MPNFLRKLLLNWCLKNFPLVTTTKTVVQYKMLVKKGKIREWRVYDANFN